MENTGRENGRAIESSIIERISPTEAVREVLAFVQERVEKIFGDELIGVYLMGSLTYG